MVANESNVEILIEPRSSDYDPSDRRWLAGVDDLKRLVRNALRDEDGDLVERERIVDGHKGSVAELLIALGTSGAISAAVMAFRAWLADGRNREIVVTRREGNEVTTTSVKAVGVSEKHLLEQLQAVLTK